jgi:hypothetical protein
MSVIPRETVDSMHDNWAVQLFRHSESQPALWSVLGIDGTRYTFVSELGDNLPSVRLCRNLDGGELTAYRQALIVCTHPCVGHYLHRFLDSSSGMS